MYSGKDLAELSGYTSRVYSLLASLHALDKDIYPQNQRPANLPDGTVSYLLDHHTKLMV
jgi:ATP-binding cassette subfamily D (ALD) long-chain fatty acid import protein